MFIIVVALLTVFLVGIVMFTDVVDQNGSFSRDTMRTASAQFSNALRRIGHRPRYRA